jgi:hypothetical protein
MFLGLAVAYGLRVDLSVGIVAMMDRNGTGVDFPVSIHVLAGATEWMVWGFEPLWGREIFPSSHQSTLGLPQAFCTMGTVAISQGKSSQIMGLTTPPI